MLVLTRKNGETVYIGDEVKITVLGVKGSQVRIGIDAPKEVPVHREEVYNRISSNEVSQEPQANPTDSSIIPIREKVRNDC